MSVWGGCSFLSFVWRASHCVGKTPASETGCGFLFMDSLRAKTELVPFPLHLQPCPLCHLLSLRLSSHHNPALSPSVIHLLCSLSLFCPPPRSLPSPGLSAGRCTYQKVNNHHNRFSCCCQAVVSVLSVSKSQLLLQQGADRLLICLT